jgi:hypothetical protein
LHSFDPAAKEWITSKAGAIVQPLHNHTCVAVSNETALLFFGGARPDDAVSDTIMLCKLPSAPLISSSGSSGSSGSSVDGGGEGGGGGRTAAVPAWNKLAVTGPAAVLEKRSQHSASFHKRSGILLAWFAGCIVCQQSLPGLTPHAVCNVIYQSDAVSDYIPACLA